MLWLQTPYCPPDTDLLEDAMEVFRNFLTWPEPYCSVCKNLLSTLQLEIKAPGKYRVDGLLLLKGHSVLLYASVFVKSYTFFQLFFLFYPTFVLASPLWPFEVMHLGYTWGNCLHHKHHYLQQQWQEYDETSGWTGHKCDVKVDVKRSTMNTTTDSMNTSEIIEWMRQTLRQSLRHFWGCLTFALILIL